MKRVLVTGGVGFIGSHLCERLLGRGDEVLCIDNFFTFRRQNIALAKARLHWEPTISLRDGLKRTIEYFKSHSGVLVK